MIHEKKACFKTLTSKFRYTAPPLFLQKSRFTIFKLKKVKKELEPRLPFVQIVTIYMGTIVLSSPSYVDALGNKSV